MLPRCRNTLAANYACASCGITFPAAGNRPILINENNSAFRIPEIETFSFMGMHQRPSIFIRLLPSPDCNVASNRNYRRLAQQLPPGARILVLGAANGGLGTEAIYRSNFTVINSDVWPGAVVDIILDAHDIPFPNESFDCVIAQAVLEHVADPYRCVAEIHRVLKPDDIVYAETPFMQQVHGAEYDFCPASHTWVTGACFAGFPSLAAASLPDLACRWRGLWEYFWMSFFNKRGPVRKLLRGMARLTAFWISWLDRWLVRRLGAYDAASGFYFMGMKAPQPISDRDLLAEFRGVR